MIPRTFVLTVNRDIARFNATAEHLDSIGLKWERFNGFDNQITRLTPVDTFDLDRAGERIGSKHIAATLTHWACWKMLSYQPEDSFWIVEYDIRLIDGWREKFEMAMAAMPDDWQIIFIGSCCCAGRETKHIKDNVYEVRYPLCGHGLMVRQSALPVLLQEHQKIAMPLDIAMFFTSLPKLRVYTILDPIVIQAGTPLPP